MPGGRGLYAYAVVHVGQFVAGMGVEIVGSAAVELVTLTDLAAHNQPDRNRPKRSRNPTDSLQQVGLIRLGLLAGGELLVLRTTGVFMFFSRFTTVGRTPAAAEFWEEPHACMIPQERCGPGVKLIAAYRRGNPRWSSPLPDVDLLEAERNHLRGHQLACVLARGVQDAVRQRCLL